VTERVRGIGGVGVTLAVLAGAAGLVLASTVGPVAMGAAVLAAVVLFLVITFGAVRVGTVTIMGALATAPMYKGLAPGTDAAVTPTDALFVIGFALLLPALLKGRVNLPISYVAGIALVVAAGTIATVLSDEQLFSGLALILWLMVLIGLPVAIGLWGPSPRMVDVLAWSYVAGHMFSQVAGIGLGRVNEAGRHLGLTNHPNYFGQAGVMAFALLLYLWSRSTGRLHRTAVLGAGAVAGMSVVLSGSRGALLVVAALVLMIPVVERSITSGLIWLLAGALLIISIPLIFSIAGDTPALDRLSGNTSSAGSDQIREAGLAAGWDRFWASPFFGDGLVDLFNIHNNYLEIAVGVGIFGLVGYLAVLYTFARPLFGHHELRRLCYPVWGYIGWGTFVPGIYDRSIWAPVALSAVLVFGARQQDRARDAGPRNRQSLPLASPTATDAAERTP